MTYAKLKTDGQILVMPNPFKLVVANPDEETKKILADLDNWLEVVYVDKPEDEEGFIWKSHFELQEGKIVQVWVKEEAPQPEPTLEDRVEDLEGGMDGLVGNV